MKDVLGAFGELTGGLICDGCGCVVGGGIIMEEKEGACCG